jgi:hypothetical protein
MASRTGGRGHGRRPRNGAEPRRPTRVRLAGRDALCGRRVVGSGNDRYILDSQLASVLDDLGSPKPGDPRCVLGVSPDPGPASCSAAGTWASGVGVLDDDVEAKRA